MVTVASEVPMQANTPFLTDEQVEAMSRDEIIAYFNRLKAAATAKGVALPGASSKAAGGTTIDQVLSRAGIFARAQHAAEKAEERRDSTKANYDTVVASYLKANNLTELPEATQAQITEHVNAARANAQSGYEKVAATNKGRAKRKGSVETHLDAVQGGENTEENTTSSTDSETQIAPVPAGE